MFRRSVTIAIVMAIATVVSFGLWTNDRYRYLIKEDQEHRADYRGCVASCEQDNCGLGVHELNPAESDCFTGCFEEHKLGACLDNCQAPGSGMMAYEECAVKFCHEKYRHFWVTTRSDPKLFFTPREFCS